MMLDIVDQGAISARGDSASSKGVGSLKTVISLNSEGGICNFHCRRYSGIVRVTTKNSVCHSSVFRAQLLLGRAPLTQLGG